MRLTGFLLYDVQSGDEIDSDFSTQHRGPAPQPQHAAVSIQKLYRGYVTRKFLKDRVLRTGFLFVQGWGLAALVILADNVLITRWWN